MSRITRRRFLQSTSAAAGASLIIAGTQASGKVIGANDRLRIAVAGVNGRGKSHITGWLGQDNVEIAYLVDPDENVRAREMGKLQERTGSRSQARKNAGRSLGTLCRQALYPWGETVGSGKTGSRS